MSRTFEDIIDDLSKKTAYGYDFLVDRYNEVMNEDGDIEHFMNVTLEIDW